MRASAALACGCPCTGQTARAAGRYVVRRSTHLPACSLGVHAHPEDRVVLTLHGQFDSIYTHDSRRSLRLDDCRAIYRPPYVEHRDVYLEPTVCLAVLIPPGDGRRAGVFQVIDEGLPLAAARLCSELEARDSAGPLVVESLAAEIDGRTWARRVLERAIPEWLEQVRDRLEDEYADPPSLDEIAGGVERHPSYVATSFRRAFGRSIGGYVREVRMWRTRPLVENPGVPLADVAHRCGFADQSHFSRLFKRTFGVTPGEYRRRASPAACKR